MTLAAHLGLSFRVLVSGGGASTTLTNLEGPLSIEV